MAVVLPAGSAVLTARGGRRGTETRTDLGPRSFVVVPAGEASVTMHDPGPLIRIFSTRSTALAASCLNASEYLTGDPSIPEFVSWGRAATSVPAVFDYSAVPSELGRFGRIYRTDAAMLNIFYPQLGPRDTSRMSPHAHLEFDQVSLQVDGDYIHHVRTPWGPNMLEWRPDDHRRCTGPAIAIFPPPLVHTSQAIGEGFNQLIDVFGPPRRDFALQPGWVLNAAGAPDD